MHVVERAVIFSESDVIEAADFGLIEPETPAVLPDVPLADPGDGVSPEPGKGISQTTRVSSAVERVEEQLIRQAMARCHGNKKRVAAELGISRSYLYKRLAQMGLGPDTAE